MIKKTVLNEACESITIVYEPAANEEFMEICKGTYYYNPKYKLNAKFYKKHTDGFWNLYIDGSEAISLRNEIEFFPLLRAVQEAKSIEKKEIPNEMFEPNKAKTIIIQ